MNCVRTPLCLRRMVLVKRFYSNNNDLTDEENKKLYEKLTYSNFNERNIETNKFITFLSPHYKFGPLRLMNYDWSLKNIYSWYKSKKVEYYKFNQTYSVDRVKTVGSDLGAAHFVVYRGGAIRFRGQNNFIKWTDKKKDYYVGIPINYDPTYFVEAIDVSNITIYYQGLENFKNLYKLKWLSLKNNSALDNWCLDYISYAIPTLEYLDISNCSKITAAGVAGLHKLTNLKMLVISNYNNIELQMACFALEDVIPGLFVTIEYDQDSKLLQKEEELNVNKLLK